MFKAWIYGLFDSSGLCRYVGSTRSPRARKPSHKRKYPEFTFRILRACDGLGRHEIENQIIHAYRARGQCDLNKIIKLHRRKAIEIIPYCVVVRRDGTRKIVSSEHYDTELF